MAPRKPQQPTSGVVRRVVRTVTTEEVIEHIVEPSSSTPSRKTAKPKTPIKKKTAKASSSASSSRSTTKPKAKPSVKKAEPKTIAGKKAEPKTIAVKKTKPKTTTVKKAEPKTTTVKKAVPKTTTVKKTEPKTTTVKKAEPKTTTVKKAPASASKTKQTAKSRPKSNSATSATKAKAPTVKRTGTKTVISSTQKKTAAKGTSSKAATGIKETKASATKAKPNIAKATGVKKEKKSLSVQPSIKKKTVSKPARKNVKKSTAAKSEPTAAQLNEAQKLHAEMRAKMFNEALQVARMEARAEFQRLASKGQDVTNSAVKTPKAEPLSFVSRGAPGPSSFGLEQRSGANPLFVTPGVRARRVKQTARRTVSTPIPSSSRSAAQSVARSNHGTRAVNQDEVWILSHETGYVPDGFHSAELPERKEVGTFTSRADAVKEGKRLVGNDVGYSWAEVCEAGDLEVEEDSSKKWEICWSPPDSQFSRVVALCVKLSEGTWLVETESGYYPDRFHSYMAPTKKTLGPYKTRQMAVNMGKNQVGSVYGIDWDEVASGGDLEIVVDNATRWEVCWSPPDSEYSRVVVKLVTAAPAQSGGNSMPARGEESDNDDYEGFPVMF